MIRKKIRSAPPPSLRSSFPRVSDAELRVMKVIWQQTPATANQVVRALKNQTPWKAKTVQTLLARLVRKGALTYEKIGREYHFRPLIQARDYAYFASRSFLGRFFNGAVGEFLACFLERERFTARELAELRRILERKE